MQELKAAEEQLGYTCKSDLETVMSKIGKMREDVDSMFGDYEPQDSPDGVMTAIAKVQETNHTDLMKLDSFDSVELNELNKPRPSLIKPANRASGNKQVKSVVVEKTLTKDNSQTKASSNTALNLAARSLVSDLLQKSITQAVVLNKNTDVRSKFHVLDPSSNSSGSSVSVQLETTRNISDHGPLVELKHETQKCRNELSSTSRIECQSKVCLEGGSMPARTVSRSEKSVDNSDSEQNHPRRNQTSKPKSQSSSKLSRTASEISSNKENSNTEVSSKKNTTYQPGDIDRDKEECHDDLTGKKRKMSSNHYLTNINTSEVEQEVCEKQPPFAKKSRSKFDDKTVHQNTSNSNISSKSTDTPKPMDKQKLDEPVASESSNSQHGLSSKSNKASDKGSSSHKSSLGKDRSSQIIKPHPSLRGAVNKRQPSKTSQSGKAMGKQGTGSYPRKTTNQKNNPYSKTLGLPSQTPRNQSPSVSKPRGRPDMSTLNKSSPAAVKTPPSSHSPRRRTSRQGETPIDKVSKSPSKSPAASSPRLPNKSLLKNSPTSPGFAKASTIRRPSRAPDKIQRPNKALRNQKETPKPAVTKKSPYPETDSGVIEVIKKGEGEAVTSTTDSYSTSGTDKELESGEYRAAAPVTAEPSPVTVDSSAEV